MRIVIVEDQLMFRELTRKVCASECGCDVVGDTESGNAAIDLILEKKPDVVILDLSLPDMDGFNVATRVLRILPAVRFLVLSAHCDEYTVFRAEKLGLPGFIDKSSDPVAALHVALSAVHQRRTYFSPAYRAVKRARQNNPNSFTKVLTDHQMAILCLIGQGLDNKEIGRRFQISRLTAECHRRNIMRKLRVHGTPQLIAFAAEHGITRMPMSEGK